jgi:hypothetical protein
VRASQCLETSFSARLCIRCCKMGQRLRRDKQINRSRPTMCAAPRRARAGELRGFGPAHGGLHGVRGREWHRRRGRGADGCGASAEKVSLANLGSLTVD